MGNRGTRQLRSGLYITSDIFCKICRQEIGWYYEHAFDTSQKDKEGKFRLDLSKLRRGDEQVEDNMKKGFRNIANFFLASDGNVEVINSIPV